MTDIAELLSHAAETSVVGGNRGVSAMANITLAFRF
jgi:hypothetical protein